MMKINRTCNIKRIICILNVHYFKTNCSSLIPSYDCIYPNLNKYDKVGQCYSHLKLMIQAYLLVGFLTNVFIKHVLLIYMYCCN